MVLKIIIELICYTSFSIMSILLNGVVPPSYSNLLFVNEGKYVINSDYKLWRASSYSVKLIGPQSIPMHIDSIGWDDNYIVALQYDIEFGVDDEPDWSKPNYYIIQLEDDTLIGPLSPEEYENSEYSYLELKKINT